MSKTDLTGKNVFVAGGTSGIGEALAIVLASRGCNIFIAGRNEELGSEVLSKCKSESPNPDAIFEFKQYDATSVASSKSLMEHACVKYDGRGGLDILILTTGGLSNGVYRETEEGHEYYLALGNLSRYTIAAGLVPQLSMRNGSIWSIMAGGMGKEFDLEDFNLSKENAYGMTTVMNRDSGIQDVLTAEFTRRHSNISYNHIYPGFVNTQGLYKQDMNPVLAFIAYLVTLLFGWAPLDYAEHLVATMDEGDRSTHYWQPKGKKVEPKPWTQDEGVGKKVLEEMEKDTGVNL